MGLLERVRARVGQPLPPVPAELAGPTCDPVPGRQSSLLGTVAGPPSQASEHWSEDVTTSRFERDRAAGLDPVYGEPQ